MGNELNVIILMPMEETQKSELMSVAPGSNFIFVSYK